MRALRLVAFLTILFIGARSMTAQRPKTGSLLRASLARMPVQFIQDEDDRSGEVRYRIQGADKTIFFTKEGLVYRLTDGGRSWVVKLEFVGANPAVRPSGESRTPTVVSYFAGARENWKVGLKTYRRIVYDEVWPGIDLVYRATVSGLKYEFVVRPGADPTRIRLRYVGASVVQLTPSGDLEITTPIERFTDTSPVAFQTVGGKRVAVEAGFATRPAQAAGSHEFNFRLGPYDRSKVLVIDPVVFVYCGFLGGTANDGVWSVAADAAGCAYVTGHVISTQSSFPVTVGPDPTFNGGTTDAFVAKVNAVGTGLVYCGYLGGAKDDTGVAIAVDAAGCAYVTGFTSSTESSFPVLGGPDLTSNGIGFDGFVAKVNATGTALVYCGYVGGDGLDQCSAIVVDTRGAAYVSGETNSTPNTFPLKAGPSLSIGGDEDAFVAKVNPSGKALEYCGYIGGARGEAANAMAVDAQGYVYVGGLTSSDQSTFPVKVGPDLTFNGQVDGFIAKIGPQGKQLVYCGYVGGSGQDWVSGVTVDHLGHATIAGLTYSDHATFAMNVGPDLTYNGNGDGFVAKVAPTGATFRYCGYIGGAGIDGIEEIAADGAGNVVVAGYTSSDEKSFPVRMGPGLTYAGGYDGFVAKVSGDGKRIIHCGYIGGFGNDRCRGVAVDPFGNIHVGGQTDSSAPSFPVVIGPDLTYNGVNDGFVAKLVHETLSASGSTSPGKRIDLTLDTGYPAAMSYQFGTSLGSGPLWIDTRRVAISNDDLLRISIAGFWPDTFAGYSGVTDAHGRATTSIHVPKAVLLIGTRFYTAGFVLDPTSVSGIRSVSNVLTLTIAR